MWSCIEKGLTYHVVAKLSAISAHACIQFTSDQFHFSLPGKAPSLLFPTGGELRHLRLDGNGTESYGAVAHSQGSLGALDVWWEQQLVVWTDLRKGTIKRARITGNKPRELLELPRGNSSSLLPNPRRSIVS